MKNLIIISVLFFSTFSAFAQADQKDFLEINQERLVQIDQEQKVLAQKYLDNPNERKIITDAYNILEIEKMQIVFFESIYAYHRNRKTNKGQNMPENPNEPSHQVYNPLNGGRKVVNLGL